MSFLSALTILLVGLKLVGVLHWNWIWILAPLWGGYAISFTLALLVGGLGYLGLLLEKKEKPSQKDD